MLPLVMIFCSISLFCCNGTTQSKGEEIAKNTLKEDSIYILTNDNRSIRLPVAGKNLNSKFVEVQIDKVLNTGMYNLAFEISFQQKDNEKLFLGTFSLFPANNPGRFIVATQKLIKNDGDIILSFPIPEDFKKPDTISVSIKSIKFLKE